MKILLTGRTMTYLSGQPLYVYTLAKELVKEHDVSVLSTWSDNQLKSDLISAGVKCIDKCEERYDLILASEFKPEANGFTINIVHSEYDCETPVQNCDFYIGIRPSIVEHIVKEHKIPKEKTAVVYNGIDRIKFSKKPKPKAKPFKLVLAPCTIDKLREKFLQHLIDQTDDKNMLMIVGDYFGAELKPTKYTVFFPSTFDIEKFIHNCDEVAGILLGRVNLEAKSCGVPSVIYDPVTLEKKKFIISEKEFDKRHNVINVAKQILDIYEKNKQ